jgi:hypothetical protein
MMFPPVATRPHHARLFLGVMGLLITSCTGASLLPPPGDELAAGTWGGDNAGVIVTDSVTHVHVGCTFGDIPGNVTFDADGRFTVDGSYVLRAYPIMVGPTLPAQFSGRVAGRRLTIAIAVNDTVEKRVVALGPVTVVYGRTPSMGPCPICRAPQRRP